MIFCCFDDDITMKQFIKNVKLCFSTESDRCVFSGKFMRTFENSSLSSFFFFFIYP